MPTWTIGTVATSISTSMNVLAPVCSWNGENMERKDETENKFALVHIHSMFSTFPTTQSSFYSTVRRGRFASQLYYGTQVSNRQCVHEPLEIRSHSARIQQQNIEPIRKTSHTTESKRKSTIKGVFEIPPQKKTYPMRRRMAVWGMWTERGGPGPAAHECGPTGGHMQRICTGQVTLSTQLLENGHQFGQMFVG